MSTHLNALQRYRRWCPTPLVGVSVVGHAAAAGLAALRPAVWPWALGALVVDHAVLAAAGLWPRCSLLGPNLTRLPHAAAARGEVALTIDDGPDPGVTPLLLDLLDRLGARVTFFCIGEQVTAQPAIAREIIRRGHAIENHSQRHLHRFSVLGPRAMSMEISSAQTAISDAVGVAPRFFRAPAGLRNPFLEPILDRLGLRLASWTRRGFDTVTRQPTAVLRRLVHGLGAGDILLLHDGNAARTVTGQPVILEVLPALLDELNLRHLRPVILADAI